MAPQILQTAPRTGRTVARRKIGDMSVSVLCLGTMTFGCPVDEADAIRMVHWALDHGVNFFDTADIYEGYTRRMGSPGGVGEQILGKALKGRRHRAIVTTKAGAPVDGPGSTFDLSPAHLARQIDRSLKRLGFDHVDIFELHHPDGRTPLLDCVAVAASFVRQGKARFWGFSNFSADEARQMVRICDENHLPRPVVSQPRLSWLTRDALSEHIPTCLAFDIAVTPYRVLENGLLTGKYRRGAPIPEGSRAADGLWFELPDDALFDRIERFEGTARTFGVTPAQYAVRWLLEQPGVTSCIVGAKHIDQIKAILPACAAAPVQKTVKAQAVAGRSRPSPAR